MSLTFSDEPELAGLETVEVLKLLPVEDAAEIMDELSVDLVQLLGVGWLACNNLLPLDMLLTLCEDIGHRRGVDRQAFIDLLADVAERCLT